VNKHWKVLANDNLVWRDLFYRCLDLKGWRIDQKRAKIAAHVAVRKRLASLTGPVRHSVMAPLSLDWQELYKNRHELDRRWLSSEPKMLRIAGHEDRYASN
jgi:F-box and WD-40 domain protein 1/11